MDARPGLALRARRSAAQALIGQEPRLGHARVVASVGEPGIPGLCRLGVLSLGCLYRVDDAAREHVRSKGCDHFNPAKLRQGLS